MQARGNAREYRRGGLQTNSSASGLPKGKRSGMLNAPQSMNRTPKALCLFLVAASLTGCLVSPVENSGGPGATTVKNSNPTTIFAVSREVFARYGYRPGPSNFPNFMAFGRPAGTAGELAFGSTMRSTDFRVQIQVLRIPGSNDFRLIPRVSRVNSAGRPGFERETQMLRTWNHQLRPLMREIRNRAKNAETPAA